MSSSEDIREDIVSSAVRFLTDPKVQSSSLAKKVSFLETKGLTSKEIEAALKRSNNGQDVPTNLTQGGNSPGSTTTSPASTNVTTNNSSAVVPANTQQQQQQQQDTQQYGYTQMAPPVPPPRPQMDWKDYFIAAVVAGGVGYGLYVVTKKYIIPMLSLSKEKEQWEEEREIIREHNKDTKERLEKLQESTQSALDAMKSNSEKTQSAIDRMVELLERLSSSQERQKTDTIRLENTLDSIRSRLDDKSGIDGQGPNISDLQSDIRSLKSLLLSRRVPASSAAPTPSGINRGITQENTPSPALNGAGGSPKSTASGNTDFSNDIASNPNAALGITSSPSIPSWQLNAGAPSSTKAGTASESAAVDASSSKGKETSTS